MNVTVLKPVLFSEHEGEGLSFANDSQYLIIHRPSVRKLQEDIRTKGETEFSEVQ